MFLFEFTYTKSDLTLRSKETISAVMIPSPNPINKCVEIIATRTLPRGTETVPPIAYSRTNAIEENTTDNSPATTEPLIRETLVSPNTFFQKVILNQPVKDVTIAILRTFTPRALSPPSAKRRDWITTTIDIQITPRLGPSTITASAQPSKCPLVPAAIGKFIIWSTKIKADIIPVKAINLSATKFLADLTYAHNVPRLITPEAAETWAFINPSGTCIVVFYTNIFLLQLFCNSV